MGATRIFVDANVLRSRTLRDWLFLLRNASVGDMFTIGTTEDVIAEVIYTLRRDKPNAPGHLTRAVHDIICDSLDYRIDNYPAADTLAYDGVDPNDAHVHAAAVADSADAVLTADKGFTTMQREHRDSLPYEVYAPDAFFVLVDNSSPTVVRSVAEQQLKYWCSRQLNVNLVQALESSGCPQFAERVRQHLQDL